MNLPDWLAADRPVRLHVLDFGLFHVSGAPGRTIGIPGFLIVTAGGRRILVDTGFPAAYASDPAGTASRDGLGDFGKILKLGQDNTLPGQLAILGLGPGDIDLTILSHSHIDHVGGLDLVAHAPIALGKAERREPKPIYFRNKRPMAWPDATYIRIDSDLDLCPGLQILSTPGHTPGHLSLRVDLSSTGTLILAADAINRATEPAEGYPDAIDPVTAAISGARLLALARETGGLLIYGHDPDQWPGLRKAPACYH